MNATQETVIAAQGRAAETFFTRFMGLMGRRQMDPEEGLLFPRTSSIHTFFMRIPIDVVYLDGEGKVLRADPRMAPNRMGPIVRGAQVVLELPPGHLESVPVAMGDRLEWHDAPRP